MAASSRPKSREHLVGDTVKCLLDAGKAPYFDREVRVRIYTYRSRNGFGISYVYIRTKVRKGYAQCTPTDWQSVVGDIANCRLRIGVRR